MHNLLSWRNLFGGIGKKASSSKRLVNEKRSRGLSFQSLEPRELMAAHLLAIQHVPAALRVQESNIDVRSVQIGEARDNLAMRSIGNVGVTQTNAFLGSAVGTRVRKIAHVGSGSGSDSESGIIVENGKAGSGTSAGHGSGVVAADSGSGSGNGSQSPIILNFTAEEGATEWIFSGDVLENGQSTTGLTVTFGGLLAGNSTTVLADNFFVFGIDLPTGLNGLVTAQTVDQNGNLSNVAMDYIST